jgi:hypothetical protein
VSTDARIATRRRSNRPGLAIAFDDFRVDVLSNLDQPCG